MQIYLTLCICASWRSGLSCVASLLLIELHATGCMHQVASLTDASLAVAAKSYAVDAFAAFNPYKLA